MSQPSPAKLRCPKCNLTLPADYDDPQCPSCNTPLIRMDAAARQAAKHDPDKSAKASVKTLRFLGWLNFAGGVIGCIGYLGTSVPLAIGLLFSGALLYAFLSVIADMADDLRQIRRSLGKE